MGGIISYGWKSFAILIPGPGRDGGPESCPSSPRSRSPQSLRSPSQLSDYSGRHQSPDHLMSRSGSEHSSTSGITRHKQCDQIGRFISLWATFQSLQQQLFCPNRPDFMAIFVKLSKSFIFLVLSVLGNFYRHFATFYWSLTNDPTFHNRTGLCIQCFMMTFAFSKPIQTTKIVFESDVI